MSDTMRDAFEAWWEEDGQFCRAGGGDYEKTFAFQVWQAAQSQPAPPVPSSVQEIMRLMMPYISACEAYAAVPDKLLDGGAANGVAAAFKPLEAALTALVDDNHRLKFELDGVNAMRRQEWASIDAEQPPKRVEIFVWNGKKRRIGIIPAENGRVLDAKTNQVLYPAPTHWMPMPASPTNGIEPEQR